MRWWRMVERVRQRLRDRPVGTQVEEIQELLNREHGPVITEIRTRFNELIVALNPGSVVVPAGAQTAYLEVVINGTEYSIPLHARA